MRSRPFSRLNLQALEVRETPANFSVAATTLTINLNNVGEALTLSTDGTNITITSNFNAAGAGVAGIGTLVATATSASYTDITIIDGAADTSVTFNTSTAPYPQNFAITLNDAASGDIQIAGNTTVANFNASTTNGTIRSSLGANFAVTAALTLDAGGGDRDILLAGPVTVTLTTSLTGYAIQADNPATDFVGAVTLDSDSTVRLHDSNDLLLAASTLGFATTEQPISTIIIGGNLTQSGAFDAFAPLRLASTGGSITLPNVSNSFDQVGFAVTGSNNIAVASNAGFFLDDVTADTGAITLTNTAGGSVTQVGSSAITTNGSFTINAVAGATTINMLQDNRVTGTVSFLEAGGDLGNTAWRNLAENIAFPTVPALASAGDINNFTLLHINSAVALGAGLQPTNLNVTAGGAVTQTVALALTGNLNVTVIGDYPIDLSTAANSIVGNVSLNNPEGTQPVTISVTGALNFGGCNLGRGAFNATATGSIVAASIIQAKGAAPATFTAGGTTIDLSSAGNIFTGNVVGVGAGVTTVLFRNADPQAKFSQLTIPASTNSLTYTTPGAPVVLPTLNLINLAVNSQGVAQAPGSTLTIASGTNVSANGFPITLTNANDLGTLNFTTSGRSDVRINDINALLMGGSSLGNGRLEITAGGNITQVGTLSQAAATAVGAVTLTSTSSITLTNNNQFRGAVHATVTGANTLSLTNQNAVPMNLGNVTTGTGLFTVTANAGITQFPGTKLTLGGASAFNSTGVTTLDNKGNSFTGDVAFNGGTFTLTSTGAVSVGTSVATSLTIRTGGAAGHNLTQTGPITGPAVGIFNTGLGNITLTNATNNFGSVQLTSQGNVAVTDANAIGLGASRLGAGTLTITAGTNITNSGAVIQTTGTGAITLNVPGANNVTLNNAGNVLRGVLDIPTANSVTISNTVATTFSATSVIGGALTVATGGVLTLPSDLTLLNDFDITATSTTIASDVTVTGGDFDVTGELLFSGNRIVTLTTGDGFVNGAVQAGGTLTFNLPAGGAVQHSSGIWNQGANNLTVNGTNATLLLGSGATPERFVMAGGTVLTLPGNGNVQMTSGSTFQVGTNDAVAEVVTLSNGTGDVTFFAGSRLQVGLGTTNDHLVLDGFGEHTLDSANVLLRTTGIAGNTPTPVLTSQTLLIHGRFQGTVDANDNPTDVFTGSDIVTPNYSLTQLTLASGGTVAPSGTATGFLPDGDGYKVTSSLGGGSSLATLVDAAGLLYAVTRNTGASAQTLTVSATGGGDGVLPVGGVMTHNTGATTISAATSDLTGTLTTRGNLLALTARDLGVATPLELTAGGAITASNAVTGRVVGETHGTFAGVLTNFSVVAAADSDGTLTAHHFGTVKTTGNLALGNPGNFTLKLTTTNGGTGVGLTSATIAGQVSGLWDIGGTVGTIKTASVNSWSLGLAASANIRNGDLLTNITKLDLGIVTGFNLRTAGHVATFNAITLVSGNAIYAKSIGVFATLGSKTLGLSGNLSGLNMTLTGNAGGTKALALGSMTSAADIASVSVLIENGNTGPVTAKMTISSLSFNALAGPLGNFGAFKAGKISGLNISATTLASVTTVQNLPAGLLGDIASLVVLTTGNLLGVGIGSVTAAGGIGSMTLTSRGGNITTVKAARTIGSANVSVTDPAFGKLGTLQAASFSGVNALARTIGTVNAAGAKAVAPASQLIIGSFDSGTIHAYDDSGTVASIGTLKTTGNIVSSVVTAERGITTMTVGRNLIVSVVVVDDAVVGNGVVGRINTLTAGGIGASTITTNTLGLTKVTGFLTPELTPTSKTFGDISGSTLTVNGVTPTKPVGIAGLTVERDITSSTIFAPFGITTLTVGDDISSSTLNTVNALNPTAGFLTTLTTGAILNSLMRVGTGGTWKVKGSTTFANAGNLTNSNIAVIATPSTKALTSLSVVGDQFVNIFDIPGNVGTITVSGQVRSTSVTRYAVGYGPGAKVDAITVGNWGGLTDVIGPRLSSNAVGSISVIGNTSMGLSGSVRNGFFDIFSNVGNIGLSSFNATGNVTNSIFRISDGDVTTFKVQRFEDSDLLVGFRPASNIDLTAATLATNWAATNRKLGSFVTTAPFNASDIENSASFRNSNVVAAILGTVTLSGVDPSEDGVSAYGIGFRTTGGSAGTLKKNGLAAVVAPGFVDTNFNYLGLSG